MLAPPGPLRWAVVRVVSVTTTASSLLPSCLLHLKKSARCRCNGPSDVSLHSAAEAHESQHPGLARIAARSRPNLPSPATTTLNHSFLTSTTSHKIDKMEDDDELPPMLVNADGTTAAEQALSAELDDVKIAKVPITIITGMHRHTTTRKSKTKCRSKLRLHEKPIMRHENLHVTSKLAQSY